MIFNILQINYLKELLNIRRLGMNPDDVYQKMLKVQHENEMLKKNYLSIKEV